MSIHGGRPSTASVDRDGNRAVITTGKIHHAAAPSRGMEAADHGVKPHCLDKPSKVKGQTVVPVHGSMHHVGEDGTLQTGVSRTESAAALRGYWSPTDPAKQHGSKSLPVPGVAWGNKSDPERGSYDPSSANKVIGEAIVSGSTKLPAGTTEST